MKKTLTGLLLFVLYGLTTGRTGVKVHIRMTSRLNCTFAKSLCKAYTSLSVVSSNEDLQMLEEAAGGTYSHSWIYSQEDSCKLLKYEDTTSTDRVWTGLRFLNGAWNWLNMANVPAFIFSLPSCPPEPNRCGARNIKTEQWENRDCEEKLNFICLKK
uniref:C-type lectin domain-containing protein n=1 Tax=Sinocyclocheilus grahami TaxID=75366 RepID=A0A672PGP5_SINGR